jgi:hypothetical protein
VIEISCLVQGNGEVYGLIFIALALNKSVYNNMKNFLKKLHIMPNQSQDAEGSNSSRGHKSSNESSSDNKFLHSRLQENKPFSGLSNWLSSVANRKSPSPPSSNVTRGERVEQPESISSSGFDVSEGARRDSVSSTSRDPDVEEEFQIQLALELSAREDPEAVQIEAVKQISLGSCAPEHTLAELIAYRYWVSLSLHFPLV